MILTLAEAAKRAGISRDTINRHAREGRFTVTIRGNGYKGVALEEFERVYGAGLPAAPAAEIDKAQYDNELSDLRRKTALQEGTIQALEKQIEQMQRQIDRYIELTTQPKAGFLSALLGWSPKQKKG